MRQQRLQRRVTKRTVRAEVAPDTPAAPPHASTAGAAATVRRIDEVLAAGAAATPTR